MLFGLTFVIGVDASKEIDLTPAAQVVVCGFDKSFPQCQSLLRGIAQGFPHDLVIYDRGNQIVASIGKPRRHTVEIHVAGGY